MVKQVVYIFTITTYRKVLQEITNEEYRSVF